MEFKTSYPLGFLIFSLLPLLIYGCCSEQSSSDNPWSPWTYPFPDPKMKDSRKAYPKEFPWMVALKVHFATFSPQEYLKCGGVLFNEKWVMTAAQCLDHPIHGTADNVDLLFGRLYLSARQANSIEVSVGKSGLYVHPEYVNGSLDFDLGLIRLSQIVVNDAIRPIPLTTTCASNYFATDRTVDGCQYGILVGWGETASGKEAVILRKADINIEPFSRCMEEMEIPFHDSKLCAIGRNREGACKGDFGGPLMCYSTHSPLTLLGIASQSDGYCFGKSQPIVFARVCSVVDWINRVTKP